MGQWIDGGRESWSKAYLSLGQSVELGRLVLAILDSVEVGFARIELAVTTLEKPIFARIDFA